MKDNNILNLYSAILSLNDKDECERFFSDLLTNRELVDLSSRLEVARLLSEGVNYIEIASRTGASTATISRVSKCLSGESGGYRTVLGRIKDSKYGISASELTLLLPNKRHIRSLYTDISLNTDLLPSMEDIELGESASGYRNTVSVRLADPRDIATILENGVADFAIMGKWDLVENDDGFEIIHEFEQKMELSFIPTSDKADKYVKIGTPYPKLAKEYFSSLNMNVEIFKVYDTSLGANLGFDGLFDFTSAYKVREGFKSVLYPYVLVCSKGASDEKKEYIKEIFTK